MIFTNLDKAVTFRPAFLHIVETCSVNVRFLSIFTPSNFSLELSQINTTPTLTHRCSYVLPDIKK